MSLIQMIRIDVYKVLLLALARSLGILVIWSRIASTIYDLDDLTFGYEYCCVNAI